MDWNFWLSTGTAAIAALVVGTATVLGWIVERQFALQRKMLERAQVNEKETLRLQKDLQYAAARQSHNIDLIEQLRHANASLEAALKKAESGGDKLRHIEFEEEPGHA